MAFIFLWISITLAVVAIFFFIKELYSYINNLKGYIKKLEETKKDQEITINKLEKLVIGCTPKKLQILIPDFIFDSFPELRPKLHLSDEERKELIKLIKKIGNDIVVFNKDTREFKICTQSEWESNNFDHSKWEFAFSYTYIKH